MSNIAAEYNDETFMTENHQGTTREEFPAPSGELLALTLVSSETGRATVEFEASERYANPMGALHSGVLCDIERREARFSGQLWTSQPRNRLITRRKAQFALRLGACRGNETRCADRGRKREHRARTEGQEAWDVLSCFTLSVVSPWLRGQ